MVFGERKPGKEYDPVAGETDENGALENCTDDEAEAALLISCDRYSVCVRLTGVDCYSDYKRAARNREFVNSCTQAELLPGTVTSDGYVCLVRGRVTLKELVCGEENLSVRSVSALAFCLKELITCARDFGVDARDFVFDYNAVLVRNTESDYKFIYLPGLRKVKDRISAGDLVRIAFLNVDTENIALSDYETIKESVNRIRPETDTDGFIADMDDLIGKINGSYEETSFKDKLFGFLRTRTPKIEEEIEPPLIFILKGEGIMEGTVIERRVDHGKRVRLKIGRDGDWADVCVPDLFASRKHAELTLSGSGSVSVEDRSMNGILINGEKAGPSIEIDLKTGDVIITITESCSVVLSCKESAPSRRE